MSLDECIRRVDPFLVVSALLAAVLVLVAVLVVRPLQEAGVPHRDG